MKFCKSVWYFVFLAFPFSLFCQLNADSAYTIFKKEKNDSTKVSNLLEVAWTLRRTDTDKMIDWVNQCLSISKTINYQKGIGKSKNYLALAYHIKGNLDTAILLNSEALTIFEKLKDSTWLVTTNKNLGSSWVKKGNFNKAINCFLKALNITELRNDKKNTAVMFVSIAQVYIFQENFPKAIECYKRGVKVLEKIDDKYTLCNALNNMAGALYSAKMYKESLNAAQRALSLATEINNEKEKTNSFIILANVYSDMGDNKKAEPYYLKSIEIQRKNNDLEGLLVSLFNISDIYTAQKQYQKALGYQLKASEIAKQMDEIIRVKETYKGIATVYALMNDYKKAYDYHLMYSDLKDTILNEESTKQITEMNTKYETEKKDKELIKKDAEIGVQSLLAEKQAEQRNYFIAGFILVGLLAVFIYRGYRQKNKANTIIETQKKEVEHQKELVEEKNKEVSDSIHYAKRIQRALLASERLLNSRLQDYFIFFAPKDIVSGDFYWASVLPNNNFALVTADSTGHGVPGAIMSMLNISCLNEAVNAQNLTQPNEILNYSRKKIIDYLANDGSAEGGKDGMDCSLIALDFNAKTLTYAAANNPVWIVRRNADNLELLEFAPDKMPVGKHDRDNTSFSNHNVSLQKGDTVYVFTDGMPDQFGGPRGKKFMYKQLKDVLLSINNLSMPEQREKLNTTIQDWMKDVEQVDDITVIGIRI